MTIQLLYFGDHIGCARDLLYIGERTTIKVDVLTSRESTRESTQEFWNQAKDSFDKYDVIVASDPELSRELLERSQEFRSHIIVWICNRITKCNDESLYELLRTANKDKITIVPSNEIERIWCNKVGIFVTHHVIGPLGFPLNSETEELFVDKFNVIIDENHENISDAEETYIVPNTENNTKFIDLCQLLTAAGVKVRTLKLHNPSTLNYFKGIIHLPDTFNAWFANETLAQNTISFVPSPAFLFELSQLTNNTNNTPYFFNVDGYGGQLQSEHVTLCNWYNYDGGRIYFSSFEELIHKIQNLSSQETINALKVEAQRDACHHRYPTISTWNRLISKCAKKAGWKPEVVPRRHSEPAPEVISTVKYLKCISAPEI